MAVRLHKYMARCGVASRRRSEELISEGKVKVNGKTVTTPGTKIAPESDSVEVEGRTIEPPEGHVYVMLNKPPGYVSTVDDEYDRPTIYDLVKGTGRRLFSVGRLDMDSRGLLLLTTDGNLAYRLTHPSHKVDKEYIVKLDGVPSEEELEHVRKGVELVDGHITQPCTITLDTAEGNEAWVTVIISEGRKRQVKRMFKAVGYTVTYLKRTRIGELELSTVEEGSWRYLTQQETKKLKQSAGLDLPST